jgi:hypothetical protein
MSASIITAIHMAQRKLIGTGDITGKQPKP